MEAFFGGLAGVFVGVFLTLVADRRLQRNDQAERLTATRREVYGEFLDAAHELFLSQRDHEEVSPHRGQIALERLRLVATLPTEAAASALWSRLRHDSRRKAAGQPWVDDYWTAEKELLTLARHDMGLEPLREGERD